MADTEKFQLQDLADNLAKAKGLQKREAQTFVRAFFNLILSALEEEKYVKISSLGTFKLIKVEPRESVDVNTGARILIESHPKITFTPDNKFKDLVNKPFSGFEPVDIEDDFDLSVLDAVPDTAMPDSEVSSDSSDDVVSGEVENLHQSSPVLNVAEVAVEAPVAVVGQTVQEVLPLPEPEVPAVSSPEEEEVEIAAPQEMEEPTEPSSTQEEIIPQEPVVEDVPEPVVEPAMEDSLKAEPVMPVMPQPEDDNKGRKSGNGIWIFLTLLLLVVAAGLIVYFKFPQLLEIGDDDNVIHEKVLIERRKIENRNSSSEKTEPKSVMEKKDTVAEKTQKAETVEPKVEPVRTQAPSSEEVRYSYKKKYRITGTSSTYEVKPGESLRVIAGKIWGDRNMDTYIVRHNNIESPDLIPVGAVLNIPSLEEE